MTDRKKELKEQYRQMKPDMGIFMIRSNINHKCYLETTPNLKSVKNSAQFKLLKMIWEEKLSKDNIPFYT